MAVHFVLEVVDLAIGPQPIGVRSEALDALHENPSVPGAVEDGKVARARQMTPEPPEVGARLLLVGRRRDGNDPVEAGVERRHHPPDRPALSGRVDPLENQDHGPVLHLPVPRQQVEPSLEALERLAVFPARQPPGQVERAKDVALVERGEPGEHDGGRPRRRFVEPPAQGLGQGRRRRRHPVTGIGPLDHDPGRVSHAGAAHGDLRHVPERVVELEALPIRVVHPPAGSRVLLECLQPPALLPLGEMQPVLENERAFRGEHRLEPQDLVDARFQVGIVGPAVDPVDDGRRVPGADEDSDLALGRQGAPETPHPGTLPLLRRRRAHGVGLDLPRVHPEVEGVDDLSLAGAVHAVDQDDDGKVPALGQLELRLEQRLPDLRLLFPVGRLVELATEFRGFEHRTPSSSGSGRRPAPDRMLSRGAARRKDRRPKREPFSRESRPRCLPRPQPTRLREPSPILPMRRRKRSIPCG